MSLDGFLPGEEYLELLPKLLIYWYVSLPLWVVLLLLVRGFACLGFSCVRSLVFGFVIVCLTYF